MALTRMYVGNTLSRIVEFNTDYGDRLSPETGLLPDELSRAESQLDVRGSVWLNH